MSICGSDFVNFASTVLEDATARSTDESLFRTVISRAYYGAFLEAREAISETSTGASVHRSVIASWDKKGKLGSKISNKLAALLDERKIADYEIDKNLQYRQAKMAVNRSNAIIGHIREFNGD